MLEKLNNVSCGQRCVVGSGGKSVGEALLLSPVQEGRVFVYNPTKWCRMLASRLQIELFVALNSNSCPINQSRRPHMGAMRALIQRFWHGASA